MPTNYIKQVGKDLDKPVAEIELVWDKAKDKAAEQGEADNYALITTIFKTMLGLKESTIISL